MLIQGRRRRGWGVRCRLLADPACNPKSYKSGHVRKNFEFACPEEIQAMVSSTTTALHSASASELANLIRSRQVSSREVVESLLARIARVNPAVNALTVILEEQVLCAGRP